LAFTSSPRCCLVVAEIENERSGIFFNRWWTIVVLPAPEGAEKMMSLPFN
jgi:hypothetical protein